MYGYLIIKLKQDNSNNRDDHKGFENMFKVSINFVNLLRTTGLLTPAPILTYLSV